MERRFVVLALSLSDLIFLVYFMADVVFVRRWGMG